jgi:hypothetical protein
MPGRPERATATENGRPACSLRLDGSRSVRRRRRRPRADRPRILDLGVSIKHSGTRGANGNATAVVTVELEARGRDPIAELATELIEMDGIVDVHADNMNAVSC